MRTCCALVVLKGAARRASKWSAGTSPPFVQQTFKHTLELVLQDHDFTRARAFVLEAAEKLLRGKVELRDLIVSKTLKAAGGTTRTTSSPT